MIILYQRDFYPSATAGLSHLFLFSNFISLFYLHLLYLYFVNVMFTVINPASKMHYH